MYLWRTACVLLELAVMSDLAGLQARQWQPLPHLSLWLAATRGSSDSWWQDMYRCICLLGAASFRAGRAPRCCNTVAWFGSDRLWHYVEWRARAATCASKCVPNWACCQTLSSAHAIAGWLSTVECSTISHGAWLLHTLAVVFFICSSWEDWPWECCTRSCLLNKVYDTCNAVVERARSRGTEDIRWWNGWVSIPEAWLSTLVAGSKESESRWAWLLAYILKLCCWRWTKALLDGKADDRRRRAA